MTEPNVNPPAEPPAEPPVTPPTLPFGDDGSLKDGWKNLLDEDIREEKSLDQFNHINGLAKSFLHTKKMVGAEVIKKPDQNSTEQEWNAYYDAGGRPATALDYGFTKPDELPPEHYDEKFAVEVMEFFHKIGLSSKQAKAVFDFNNNHVIENLKTLAHNDELEVQQAKDELIKEMGVAYQTREHLGNVAIEIGCKGATPSAEKDSELKDIIIDEYGANPFFARMMMNIGKHFAEHESVVVSGVPTNTDIQKQIQEIMAKPEYSSKEKKIRQPLVDEVQRLYVQLNKSKGIS